MTRRVCLLLGIIFVSLFLCLPADMSADTVLTAPVVTPYASDAVIVSWDTPESGSSQVDYRFGDLFPYGLTPEYATHTAHHQMKVTGLEAGQTYFFSGLTIADASGAQYTTPFTPYTLEATISPLVSPAANPTTVTKMPTLTFAGLALPFTAWAVNLRQTASMLGATNAVAAWFVGVLAVIVEQLNFGLLVSWVLLAGIGAAVFRWRRVTRLTVIDRVSGNPVAGAKVAILAADQAPVTEYVTDADGTVPFSWTSDRPATVRITAPYFQPTTVTVNRVLGKVRLGRDEAGSRSVADARPYQLRDGTVARRIWLSLGFLMVIINVAVSFGVIALATVIAYLVLGVLELTHRMERWRPAEVTDAATARPIPRASVTLYRGGRVVGRKLANDHGRFDLAYPLPDHYLVASGSAQAVSPRPFPAEDGHHAILELTP